MKEHELDFDAFPPTGLPAWERASKEELQGADPWKKLTKQVHGIEIKPFYSEGPSVTESFHLQPSKGTFLGPRTWYNCPLVVVSDPARANALALEHLKQGADGIFFELEEGMDFSILLKSIEWSSCSLNFLAKKNTASFAKGLERFLSTTKGPTHGALFGIPQVLPSANKRSFRFIGLEIPTDQPPIEALANGIASMNHVLGDAFRERFTEAAFSVEIGADFFFEAAKLRALRDAWQNLLAKRGADAESPLFIHAWSRAWTNETYSPHGNMLKATTAAMSAILGGCDALTVDAEDPGNATMSRAARNVSNVLREESHFSKVSDPLAGSYFVDDLTKDLSEQVWRMAQLKMKS